MEQILESFQQIEEKSKIGVLLQMINSIKGRLSWDEYFILIASFIKKRSSCDRLQVGCVITKDNRILCTGYNGHVPGAPHTSKVIDNHEQMTIHAEVNAICHAAKYGINLENSKAYITHFPCINCAKSLIAAGINEVAYLDDYKNSPIVNELFMSKGVKVNKISL